MNTNISDVDFSYVSDLACRNSAIILNDSKKYLVETRLEPLARRMGCQSLAELISALRAEVQFGQLHAEAIDALTTNETYFFRDFHPFDALKRSILPELIMKNSATRSLSIWCAACSTGQEPYSIAMTIREHFPELANWRISITATDLSPTVLEQAKAGRYNQIEVNRGLPANLLIKYFKKEEDDWVIDNRLRDIIQFREMNLIKPWPIFPPFDLIFMRNVLIYFDVETKRSILNKLSACIRKSGYLFLGSSESVLNIDDSWELHNIDKTVAYKQADESTMLN
ncbi:MAG: protein-glutamate O-methyltransferase CheR [Symploca sp. SIO2D2]|nr:protein-glutamate O-methyltransferase CheR [Symploca sp. SIO2D2]